MGKPDLVVAFPGGAGTLNMVMQARKAGVRVIEIDWPKTLADHGSVLDDVPDCATLQALALHDGASL